MKPSVLTAVDKDELRRLRIVQDDDLTPASRPRPEPSSSDDTHEPADQ